MRKLLNPIIILIVLVFTSCQKKLPKCTTVAGVVEFKIKDGIKLSQIKTLIVNLNIEHYLFDDFYYTKNTSADSDQYYNTIFSNCNYLNSYHINHESSVTRFVIRFKELTNANHNNWDSIVAKEQLNEMPDACDSWIRPYRRGYIYIPNTQEDYWIKVLENCPEILSADYYYTSNSPCVK